eukprot:Clim_evm20s47 gene=Clim_evmTU20s47
MVASEGIRCCICSSDTPDPIVCNAENGCGVPVHAQCYGTVQSEGPWKCDRCRAGISAAALKCALCPSKKGAFKEASPEGWAHVVCALYVPNVKFGDPERRSPVVLDEITPAQWNSKCYICSRTNKSDLMAVGVAVPCASEGCKKTMHVTCAQQYKLLIEDNGKHLVYCVKHIKSIEKAKQEQNQNGEKSETNLQIKSNGHIVVNAKNKENADSSMSLSRAGSEPAVTKPLVPMERKRKMSSIEDENRGQKEAKLDAVPSFEGDDRDSDKASQSDIKSVNNTAPSSPLAAIPSVSTPAVHGEQAAKAFVDDLTNLLKAQESEMKALLVGQLTKGEPEAASLIYEIERLEAENNELQRSLKPLEAERDRIKQLNDSLKKELATTQQKAGTSKASIRKLRHGMLTIFGVLNPQITGQLQPQQVDTFTKRFMEALKKTDGVGEDKNAVVDRIMREVAGALRKPGRPGM